MSNVAQVLRSKASRDIHRIAPSALVFEAVRVMAAENVGALLVMDGEKVAGILTERDYARKIVVLGKSSREVLVRDVMTTPVMYVSPQQTVEECMALMTEKRLRHLPVIDDGKLVGLISIGDLVKEIISEQKYTIDQMVHYISG